MRPGRPLPSLEQRPKLALVPGSHADRKPFILAGALPRAGNHLLRGLLDHHPELLLPPDEDYFFRHLLRSPLTKLRGMLCSPARAPDFYRALQKQGHLERVNAGRSKNARGTQDLLDLRRYYQHVRGHHSRFSVAGMVRTHVGALEAALGVAGEGRTPVLFCAVQASKQDVLRQGRSLAALYDLRAVFVLRDPRAHYASKLGRKPGFDVKRFCQLQNAYAAQVDAFERHAPSLKVRFEDLVHDTANSMRRVCAFLGIAYSDQAASFTLNGQPTSSNSSFGSATGIDTSTLARYRETLPAETLGYIESHCAPQLFWQRPPTS